MLVEPNESCPLPDDPVLAEMAAVVAESGDWAWIVDRNWRLRYMTDEQRWSFGAGAEMIRVPLGEFLFGPEVVGIFSHGIAGLHWTDPWVPLLSAGGGLMLADMDDGRDQIRANVDPSLHHLLPGLSPTDRNGVAGLVTGTYLGTEFQLGVKVVRIRDTTGSVRGTIFSFQPAIGMGVIGSMAVALDPGHLERMASVRRAARTPAAVLFADLEGSAALSRTLSTANYFALGRRIVRATDQCVVDAGGLAGRHLGDGVVAFFPIGSFDSESDAAQACITTAYAIRGSMDGIAARSGLDPDHLVVRFGLHWGSTIHIGNITTSARFEVTALGDEVNEAARIEACASGGRILASKPLVERLDAHAAQQLGINPDRLTYTQLSELKTATDKARRDAPAIAVCEL